MPRDDKIRELCARVAVTRGDAFYAAMMELEDEIDSYLVSLPEFSMPSACPQCGKPIPIAQTKRPGNRCPHCEAALVN